MSILSEASGDKRRRQRSSNNETAASAARRRSPPGRRRQRCRGAAREGRGHGVARSFSRFFEKKRYEERIEKNKESRSTPRLAACLIFCVCACECVLFLLFFFFNQGSAPTRTFSTPPTSPSEPKKSTHRESRKGFAVSRNHDGNNCISKKSFDSHKEKKYRKKTSSFVITTTPLSLSLPPYPGFLIKQKVHSRSATLIVRWLIGLRILYGLPLARGLNLLSCPAWSAKHSET